MVQTEVKKDKIISTVEHFLPLFLGSEFKNAGNSVFCRSNEMQDLITFSCINLYEVTEIQV